MAIDFSSDARLVMREFSNTNVLVGLNSIRGIFSAPSKTLPSFDLGVVSTEPTCTLLTEDVENNGIDSGSLLTISLNGADYQVLGAPDSDGEGLTIVTLTEPQ